MHFITIEFDQVSQMDRKKTNDISICDTCCLVTSPKFNYLRNDMAMCDWFKFSHCNLDFQIHESI